ncbi:MAG: hypothetical protein JW939_07485 [Candidatus Thermoplasmatota archaeon]|nr:hypothetical protein [Candidatus Thermoplasmatota archaeon]
MKDLIQKCPSKLDAPSVMETIKERMVEYRFNIDEYDLSTRRIEGRRNNLDKVILGLNRKLAVSICKEKDRITIDLKWSSLLSNCAISGFEFFFIAMAVFRSFEFGGFLISLAIGAFGALINLLLFMVLRLKLGSTIERDLDDLEKALEEGKRKGRMGIF